MKDKTKTSIGTLRESITSKKHSAQEIAKEYIGRAKKENDTYNAFLCFSEEYAIKKAKEIDAKVAKGRKLGKLAGVPIALKDNILLRGYPSTAGSKILEHYKAVYNADVVEFLDKEDAVIIGKTNMDEFAMGSSSETSAFGRVKHPKDTELVPGGSSGGSASAVARGQALCALGSDTGGSIRQPAAFSGIVGLKPTYGRVSRSGLIAMASSLDQIGPLTTNVRDAAILLEVISAYTQNDQTYARKDFHWPELSKQEIQEHLKNIRIGVPREYFAEGLEPEIAHALQKTMEELKKIGVKVIDISLPSIEYALACYYVLMPAEVSSNMARYDGLRYGKIQDTRHKTQTLQDWYRNVRQDNFGKEVQRRIMLGSYVLSAGYVDKYYLKAQRVREKIVQEMNEVFKEVDIVAGPTAPTFPFAAGEKLKDPLAMYLADIYTVGANLAGVPGISIPLNTSLPSGLQLLAPHFEEARLLIAAKGIEYSLN